MVSEDKMKAVLQLYVDSFNKGDAETIISLFAEDAKVEDPVGGGKVIEGKKDIALFFQKVVKLIKKIELDTPIRGSQGLAAAMAFTLHMERKGKKTIIQVIDVMTFNESGEITEMKAYFGPSDIS